MTEAQIADLILKDDGRTRVQLSDFRRKTVDIGNILTEEDGAGDRNENIGHVKQIYMFGYYEGVLPGTESGLSIYLGRIIARIEVNFTIDDPEDLKKKFYIGLANMETKAYVFPGAQSPNAEDAWLDMKPTERSEEIRTGACQFYFLCRSAFDRCFRQGHPVADMVRGRRNRPFGRQCFRHRPVMQ